MPPQQLQDGLDKCKSFWHEHVNFLELHYLYIGALCFIVAGLFYCQPGTDWNFVDALYMAATAVTNTGLNSIDMSELSIYQYLLMLFASLVSAPVTIPVFVVCVRKHYFSKRFEDVLLYNRAQRLKEENRRRLRRQQQQWRSNTMPAVPPGSSHHHHFHLFGHHDDGYDNQRIPSFYSVRSATASKIMYLLSPVYHSSTLDERAQASSDRIDALHSNNDGGYTNGSPTERSSVTSVTPPRAMQRAATVHETNNIAFADDIDQQRQQARQRLEQERKFDHLLRKIATAGTGKDNDDQLEDAEEEEEEVVKSIMQQPIHPHQLTRRQRYHVVNATELVGPSTVHSISCRVRSPSFTSQSCLRLRSASVSILQYPHMPKRCFEQAILAGR